MQARQPRHLVHVLPRRVEVAVLQVVVDGVVEQHGVLTAHRSQERRNANNVKTIASLWRAGQPPSRNKPHNGTEIWGKTKCHEWFADHLLGSRRGLSAMNALPSVVTLALHCSMLPPSCLYFLVPSPYGLARHQIHICSVRPFITFNVIAIQ